MDTLKLFIASSMTETERNNIKEYVDAANKELKNIGYNYEFKVFIYGETAIPDGIGRTQDAINKEARLCDVFILLARNNIPIGEITIEEYKNALEKHNESPNKSPYIKVFCIKKDKNEKINLPFREKTNNGIKEQDNFEKQLDNDCKGYIQWIDKEDEFKYKFIDYLKAFYQERHLCKQEKLSYEYHIKNTDQKYRKISKEYISRKFDSHIKDIAKNSSLIILEGNTYSGKTRAAYELMKNNADWKDYNFYIYQGANNSTINDLNQFNIDLDSNQEKGNIVLIDDFNEIIKDEKEIKFNQPFWKKLRDIDEKHLPKWGNNTIILTISGKLTDIEKSELYTNIFGETYYKIDDTLNNLTVNFNYSDKKEFKLFTDEIVRKGYLKKEEIRPGNYTLGALFIDESKMQTDIKRILKKNPNIIYTLRSIKMHWMFSSITQRGNISELRKLYKSIKKDESPKDDFDRNIEELRKNSFLVYEKKEDITKIMIDDFIIEAITKVVDDEYTTARQNDFRAALIFAHEECNKSNNYTLGDKFDCVEHMGYLLCDDKNYLSDKDIETIINEVYSIIFHNGNKLSICQKMINLCYDEKSPIYAKRFCAKAISRLSDFDNEIKELKDLMMAESEIKNTAEILYKDIIYAMFSDKKVLTIEQENKMLGYIFDSDKKFIHPFQEEDLTHILTLKRMIPFIDRNSTEIFNLILNAGLEDTPKATACKRKFYFEAEDPIIERILIPQIGAVIIAALQKTVNYSEFIKFIDDIKKEIADKSKHNRYLTRAISEKFTYPFYKGIKDIAIQYDYENRKKIFDYLINIDESKGPFENINIVDKQAIETYQSIRIQALNTMLELLNGNGVLEAYNQLKEKNLCDYYTFSMLIKNKFLEFEHLYHLIAIDREDKRVNNFITQNQMLQKAETLSDARSCLLLIGKNDASELRDEYALGNYLNIKQITSQMCIDIIKKWREKNEYTTKNLSATTIGVILNKFSYDELNNLFDENNTTEANCKTKYGLTFDEITIARKNVICLNYLFIKGKDKNLDKIFEKLEEDESTRKLIVNWQENENTSILSSYMRNLKSFPTYEKLKAFTTDFFNKNKQTLRRTEYTYKQLLWMVIKEYKNKDKNKAIEEINQILIDAYKYFAQLYNRKNVVKKMSELYNYRLRILSQEDYEKELDYAYEDKTFNLTFSSYLDKLIKENSSHANDKFIKYALISMQKFDQEIYDKICTISQRNHKGIDLDSLTSKELSKCVKDKLLKIEKGNGVIIVEEKILHNYSPIKLLLWLLQNNEIKYSDAEKYLQEHKNVEITQTYLNIAFKTISYEHYRNKDSKEAYSIMDKLWPDTKKNPTLYPSIEMLLAMIRITKKKEDLEETINKFEENIYHNSPQFIDTLIRQKIYLYKNERTITKLLDELRYNIIKYKNIINITIINSYLYGLITIWKGEFNNASNEEIEIANNKLKGCWEKLQSSNGKINIHQLLGTNNEENSESWEIEADAQTYTFFPMCNSNIIQLIDEKFNGNFYYDESHKKCCLFDALKNYAFYINKIKRLDVPNYNELSEILIREEHKKTRYEIYEKIIFNNQNPVDDYWFELLKNSDLMCKEIIDLFKHTNIYLDFRRHNDRIYQLRDIYIQKQKQPNPSYDWKRIITEVYNDNSLKNKKLYEKIFMQM